MVFIELKLTWYVYGDNVSDLSEHGCIMIIICWAGGLNVLKIAHFGLACAFAKEALYALKSILCGVSMGEYLGGLEHGCIMTITGWAGVLNVLKILCFEFLELYRERHQM